jgi:hypothetical protein
MIYSYQFFAAERPYLLYLFLKYTRNHVFAIQFLYFNNNDFDINIDEIQK